MRWSPAQAVAVSLLVGTSCAPDEKGAAAILRLVDEQHRFADGFAGRTDWSADEYVEWLRFETGHSEPTFREFQDRMCTNLDDIFRTDWEYPPMLNDHASYLYRWTVDVDTIKPADPDWTSEIFDTELGPFEGRMYEVTATYEFFDGTSFTSERQLLNVQGDEAYWFADWDYFDTCVAA